MKTFFARMLKKSVLPAESVSRLERECTAFNVMLPLAVKIQLNHDSRDPDSVYVAIRKKFPDDTYIEKYGRSPIIRGGERIVATNFMGHNLESAAKGVVNSALECAKRNLETQEDRVRQIEKKLSKEQKALDRMLAEKESLKVRSIRRKEGKKRLPAFRNREKDIIRVEKGERHPKYGETLIFYVDLGARSRSRDKQAPPPLVFSDEYQFEKNWLQPRIRQQKAKIGQIQSRLHNAKDHLRCLRRDFREGKAHICLGTKAVFHKQFDTPSRQEERRPKSDRSPRLSPEELQKADAAYHQKWLKEYRAARSRPLVVVGCAARPYGNDSVSYDIGSRTLTYTTTLGEKVELPGVKFRYGQDLIDLAVTADFRKALKENRRPKRFDASRFTSPWKPIAVTWGFRDLGKYFQITCSIEPPVSEPVIRDRSVGCVGIDINYDRIAIGETDSAGQLLCPPKVEMGPDGELALPRGLDRRDVQHILYEEITSRSSGEKELRCRRCVPLRMEGRSSEQIESDISSALEHVFIWAKMRGKVVTMEDIDKLKKDTLYCGKKRNFKVSMFAHRKITELAENKARKYGVDLLKVNPAFTSQIGKFKYMRRFGLSIHECAAYAIARRGMGLRDPVPEELFRLIPEKIREKDEWSQWNYLMRVMTGVPVRAFYRNIPYDQFTKATQMRDFLVPPAT